MRCRFESCRRLAPVAQWTRAPASEAGGREFDPLLGHMSEHADSMLHMPRADRREYMRRYQQKWKAARRAAYFAGKCCVRCGSTERLELDHIDPSTRDSALKAFHTADFWSWSMKRIEAEIAKCQVLCRKCHEAKTMVDLGQTGHSRRGYDKGCRCVVCVEANNSHNRRRRARVKRERAAVS